MDHSYNYIGKASLQDSLLQKVFPPAILHVL